MEINTPYYDYASGATMTGYSPTIFFGAPVTGGTVNPLYSASTKYTESVGTPQPNNRNNKQPPQRVPKEDIMAFQQWAIANGYAPKGAKADGYFGPQTRQMINTSGMDKLMYTDQKTGKPVWAGSTGMALEQGAAIADYGNGKINQNGVINAANLSAVDNTKFDMIPKQSKGTYNDQMQAMQNAYAQQQQQQAPVVVQAPQESLARMNDPLDGTIMSDAWQRTLGYRQ